MAGAAIMLLADALCATRFSAIPPETAHRAADCILDALGAALAGRRMRSTQAMQAVMMQGAGTGAASVWFGGRRLAPIPAATINTMAATALDIDDGHRRAAGHPGAATIAAAVAMAEQTDAAMSDLIAAIVVGYEAAVRVALARAPEHNTSTVSGRWSGVGAAAASALLQNCPPEVMAQAILIAEQHAPRASSAMHHGFAGSDLKEAIAWSVHTGLHAAELARNGFTGYPDTFDQGILYEPDVLCHELDRFDAIAGLFFKPYACCRWIHSAIDGLDDILRTNKLQPENVDKVRVRTFRRAIDLGNHVAPETEAQAQFSIPFCLGVVAVHGTSALTPLDPALLGDQRIRDFARKVTAVFDADIDAMFPTKAPATVEVGARGTAFSAHVDAAFGDPSNPMSRADLQAKFNVLTRGLIAPERARHLQSALAAGSGGPVRDILADIAEA